MVDEADLSAEAEENARLASLATLLNRQKAAGASLSECAKCGETIPEARRSAVPGCKLCIECARKAENVTGRLFPNA